MGSLGESGCEWGAGSGSQRLQRDLPSQGESLCPWTLDSAPHSPTWVGPIRKQPRGTWTADPQGVGRVKGLQHSPLPSSRLEPLSSAPTHFLQALAQRPKWDRSYLQVVGHRACPGLWGEGVPRKQLGARWREPQLAVSGRERQPAASDNGGESGRHFTALGPPSAASRFRRKTEEPFPA